MPKSREVVGVAASQVAGPNEVVGAKGTTGSSRSVRRTEKVRLPGRRTVKEYPVDRDELFELGGAGLLTTLFFSIGFSLLSRYLELVKDLEFERDLPKELIARWSAIRDDAYTGAAIFISCGIVVFLVGGAKIWSIIRSTEHDRTEGK